jgi:hypothetical protein
MLNDMPHHPDHSWFEAAWAQREEQLYPTLFGALGPGIYPLDGALFSERLGQTEIDPRWLTIGVFESPPNAQRDSWLYVTSGLSNAWHDAQPEPTGVSGMGQELLLESREQAPWALSLLRKLAGYQILLDAGRFPEQVPLNAWDRMPMGVAIDGADSLLQTLLFVPAPTFGDSYALLSGHFEFLQVIGLSQGEHAWAKEHKYEPLLQRLLDARAAPVIDPRRATVL